MKALVLLALLATSNHANAQVIFQREKLIISPPPVTKIIADETSEKAETPPPQAERLPQTFMVEVRSEDALNLEYIHTLNGLKDDSGVMIAFSVPSIVNVPTMKVYEAVDVLFIDENGVILQILPDIVPAEITRDIAASKPVSAFLYIKAGEAEKRGIRPRDVATHSLFSANPVILR